MKSTHYRYSIYLILCLVFLFSGCGQQQEITEENKRQTVELFYFNPCESCREDKTFIASVREILEQEYPEEKFSYEAHNTFRISEQEYMERRLKENGYDLNSVKVPFALVQGKIYMGEYQEIASQIADHVEIIAEDKENSAEKPMEDQIFLFTTTSCKNCQEVEEYLNTALDRSMKMQNFNITKKENLEFFYQLIQEYQVPEKEQQVPLLFCENGYLSGKKAITDNLEKILQEEYVVKENTDTAETTQKISIWKTISVGVVNGLNPCAASMLLMVLSILMVTGKNLLKGSFSYLAGKWVAYFAMGTGLSWLLALVEGNAFHQIVNGITIVCAIIALILSMGNFVDYWNTKKGEYGKVLVQLPRFLREWNHHMIQKLKNVSMKWLIPVLFVMGIIISAGEFFCTGQLYAASIVYLLKQREEFTRQLFLLAVYVTALCSVQAVLIFAVNKSRNLVRVSGIIQKGMPSVKLLSGIIFLILFFLLIL